MERIKTAVLISGGGSNLQALINACKQPDFPAQLSLVISNIPNAYGLERAKTEAIPAVIVDHTKFQSREDFDNAIQTELEEYKIEIVCLAGFMRILTSGFVNKWRNRMLNTHPALLPRHGGKGMHGMHVHKAVLAAGDTESGVSIHHVIPEVDQGEIILQKQTSVLPNDTAEDLAGRVLQLEHQAYPEALRIVAESLLKSPRVRV